MKNFVKVGRENIKVTDPWHPYEALKEVMSLTFFLFSPGSSGLSHFSADRFVSVFLLDRQRDGGDLWKFLSPAGSVLLDEHLGDPGRRRHRAQRHTALARKVFCSYVRLALENYGFTVKQLNGVQPPFILLFTPVLFSAVTCQNGQSSMIHPTRGLISQSNWKQLCGWTVGELIPLENIALSRDARLYRHINRIGW